MKILKQYRFWAMWAGALAVVLWYFVTDPDQGLETVSRLQWLAWLMVCAGPVYLMRRALMDGARSNESYRRALENPIGAGLVFLGLCLLSGLLFLSFASRAHGADLPARALTYLPLLKAEQAKRWPGHPAPAVLASLVEQETCPGLVSEKCWNPRTELKTSREYGFGLGQKTVAYKQDGTERFNAWRESRAANRDDLAQWNWGNRFDARMQLRALVLDNRECYRRLTRLVQPGEDALAMCDSAYNGGYGGLLSDRRLCWAHAGCEPNRWFGHVALHSVKSRTKWRGYGASAYDINRTHVHAVMVERRPRYTAFM